MPTFAVDINTYFTVEGDTKEQVEEFVKANLYVAEIEGIEFNDYGIEIKEM